MNRSSLFSAVLVFLSCGASGTAAELVLAAGGRSEYQIVVPDQYPSPAIGECLSQTARLLRTAFEVNRFEAQVTRLAASRIHSIHRDGPGQLFGLEGPVYYVMGRMFEDPEGNTARQLVPEFCEAAFGKAARPMRSFYDRLYGKPAAAAEAGGWSHVLFPFAGHDANHLRLAYDGYQEPYAGTCLNWDTAAVRRSPLPGNERPAGNLR